jgi:hypothetical protein
MTMTDLIETNEQHEAARREAQLVAHTLHGGVKVITKTCWQCGTIFYTNNEYFNLCSDWCLSDYLYDRGVNWDPEAEPEDRWPSGESDAIITSDVMLVLQVWARKILKLPTK